MLAHISIFVTYFHIFRYLIYAILNTFRHPISMQLNIFSYLFYIVLNTFRHLNSVQPNIFRHLAYTFPRFFSASMKPRQRNNWTIEDSGVASPILKRLVSGLRLIK